jgi:hypothetical protein
MRILKLILEGLINLFQGDFCGTVRCFKQVENELIKIREKGKN